MRIFVTGGAGFIGSHLCKRLIDDHHFVTAYDNLILGRREFLTNIEKHPRFRFVHNDLLTDARLAENLQGHDLVVHLAANSDIRLGEIHTDLDMKAGAYATYKLLAGMRAAAVKQIMFSSTSAVYGEAKTRPTTEDYGPLLPISFYGASKLAAEALLCAFAHQFDINVWIYRFANVVGANLTHGAIFDFVAQLKAQDSVLRVLGNGLQKKSYLHVDDCISGMWHGFRNSSERVNIFNLASQGVTEVRFIVNEVLRLSGSRAVTAYGQEDRGWKSDVPFTWLDSAKLSALGWRANLTSDEAVTQSVAEYLQRVHSCKQ